jgi:fatty acid desaturase
MNPLFDLDAFTHLITSTPTYSYSCTTCTTSLIAIALITYFGCNVYSYSKQEPKLEPKQQPPPSSLSKSTSSSSLSSSTSNSSSTSIKATEPPPNPSSLKSKPSLESKPKTKSSQREITWKELKQHSTTTATANNNESKELWISINKKVYNITNFTKHHPGGDIIYAYAGRDATDEFNAFHLPRVATSRLPSYCIGTLIDGPDELPITTEYRKLHTSLWKEGWFEADTNYYVKKDILALCILCFGIYFCLYGTSCVSRVVIGGSIVGLALQQVAFVAHDAGHRGITHPKPGGGINYLGWFHGAVCFGVSIEMWVDEHSGHHAMTMRPHEDPQFKYLPVFLISNKELERFHELSYVEQVIAKFIVPFQHYTLIPISVIIGRFNLHAISMIYALKSKKYYDVAGLVLYLSWFGTLVSYLPSKERLPFVLVSYIVAGILHIQLTISHLATDSFTAEEDEVEQFFAFQCKTTRNIDCTWWNDWFHGGLQYQIEHHLFPQMPRHALVKVKPMVEELCKKYDIPYRSTGFFHAVGVCLSDFRRLSTFLGDLVHPHEIMPE